MVLQDFLFLFSAYHSSVTSFETKNYGFLWGLQGIEGTIQQYFGREESLEFVSF